MSEKLIHCKCCKKAIILIRKTRRKYCDNCSRFVFKVIARLRTKERDKCRKCKKELEQKYNYIATIREPINEKKTESF